MKRASPKIVFLGVNELGHRILEWLVDQGEHVACLLTLRGQLSLVRRLKPDLVLSCGFRHLVPAKYLVLPPLGCINVHTSYLPFNRGTYTNAWSILEDTPAGVSIHKMAPRVDSGPILARKRVEVVFRDTGKTLFEKLQAAGFELFKETWPSIRSGEWKPLNVSSDAGTYHRDEQFWDLMRVDLDRMYRGAELIRRLRALTFPPYDNAFVEVDGKRYYLRLEVYEAAGNGVRGQGSENSVQGSGVRDQGSGTGGQGSPIPVGLP